MKLKTKLPWKSSRPMRLTRRPAPPTMSNNCGLCISSVSRNLLHASTVIEKHIATRNTAFTNAPNTSALAQPNVFLDHFFGDI